MKGYNQNKKSPYLIYWGANNLYGWALPQKLPVENFEWERNISNFDESFTKKIIVKIVIKNISLKSILNTLNNCTIHTMIYHFKLKE